MPGVEDADEVKKTMVRSISLGRTDSLKELKESEYMNLCRTLEKIVGPWKPVGASSAARSELKKKRSMVLQQMQLYGVNTADWDRVNEFCRNPRIAGKVFRELSCEELEVVRRKLLAMRRKKEG